jgi:imidazolonepropionase-like amidohydrolase
MTRSRALLCGALLLAGCAPSGEGVLVLEGATLLDGSGGRPLEDAVIVVRDGRIEAVARVGEIRAPKGARVELLVGKTIIPGLIDAHAHVERWALPLYLAWGVTTVRDMGGGTSESTYALQRDLKLGAVIGPRMFTAGPMIDGPPATYRGATEVATAEEAGRAVGQRAIAGADYLKVYTKITPGLLRALKEEASVLRLPIAAHLGRTDALTAARIGVASIEHLSGIVQAAAPGGAAVERAHDLFLAGWTAEQQGWTTLDSATIARTARTLAQAGVAIVPTLVLYDMLSRLDDRTLLARPEMAELPAAGAGVRDVAGLVRRAGWRPVDFATFRAARRPQHLFVREFKRANGLVAAGSDAANQLLVPGAALHDELALLVDAGLARLEAITAATRHAARLLDADSLGSVAVGKVADLVILNANPADDIAATRDIAAVVIRGQMLRVDSLRATWRR